MTTNGLWKFESWLALCLVVGGAVADARADDSWLGQQVFVKETAKPKLGNKIIPWNEVGMPATVSKVEGDWLWLGKVWVAQRRGGEARRRSHLLRQSPQTRSQRRVRLHAARCGISLVTRDYETPRFLRGHSHRARRPHRVSGPGGRVPPDARIPERRLPTSAKPFAWRQAWGCITTIAAAFTRAWKTIPRPASNSTRRSASIPIWPWPIPIAP